MCMEGVNINSMWSQRWAIEHHCKHLDLLSLFSVVYVLMQAMFGRSTRLQQVSSPKHQPTALQPCDPGVLLLLLVLYD